MSYDPKCDDLARAFLAEEKATMQTEQKVARLAHVIQDAIEAELEDMRPVRDKTCPA